MPWHSAGLRKVARQGRWPRACWVRRPWTDRFCESLGIGSTSELVTAVYRASKGSTGRRLPRWRCIVVAAAEEDPSIFSEILEPAGKELALMVAAVAGKLEFGRGPLPVAMAGGFLLKCHTDLPCVILDQLADLGYERRSPHSSPIRSPRGLVALGPTIVDCLDFAMIRVATGLEIWVAERFSALKGLRVGVIANPTSVDRLMVHIADHLRFADGSDIGASTLSSRARRPGRRAGHDRGELRPQHPRTGVPVHTLYGPDFESLTPRSEHLDGLDALIFDVQDVGSRCYTFAATMLYAMTSAAKLGLRFFVLDRPNPIGGERVEGPTIRPGFESFVGPHPVSIRHGMTVGSSWARLFVAEGSIDLDLTIVPCSGWKRSMLWSDTGRHWVLPSPNMPTPDTALVYPGGCLIEGTNLSEGRGTTRPFELWGAPWLDSDPLAEPARWTAGTLLRPCAFRPTFHKHAGKTCFGIQPHVEDPEAFAPVWFYTAMLAQARSQRPDLFGWRRTPYEFVVEPIAIDLLYGSDRERLLIETGPSKGDLLDLRALWAVEEAEFLERRAPHLLYN